MPMTNNNKIQVLNDAVRLFQCARCLLQVTICTHCDRGNIYCSKACSIPARKVSHCAASKRYQRTSRGKQNHARCQQRYRAKRLDKMKAENKKVIDQSSPSSPHELSSPPMNEAGVASQETQMRCDFCGRPGNVYARWHFLNYYRRSRIPLSSSFTAVAQGP